jgi:hypothetical protein
LELKPAQRVVWRVLDNYFKFTEDKAEWINPKIVFDIARKNDKTNVRLTATATGKGEPTTKGYILGNRGFLGMKKNL